MTEVQREAGSKSQNRAANPSPDPAEPIRIVDLARELGLSIATVSRVLNNSRAVRPDVAERVRAHAAERGYVANRLARSLRSRKQGFVGFLVPAIENLAYSIAADACAQYISRSGHQMILAISGDDPELEFQALRSLAEAQIGAIVVAPSPAMSAESQRLLANMSVLEFNRTAGLSDNVVLCDDRAAFVEATSHLLKLGHETIGYIGTTESVSNGRERLEGVRDELQRRGKQLSDRHTRLLPPTEGDGYQAARELLALPDRPTAVLVGSSNLSLGVARAVRHSGVSVPRDMSLIVYGDSQWGELFSPTLTTVTVPYREMGLTVASSVAGILSDDDGAAPKVTRMPAKLLVRESTAPPPATSRRP
ncbi:MAG TPA: LacI family DNA-binding transcriptional regulator [Arthrobacter sp.]|nr:LacI family DNA-binding transcriptional regulator [Arthrobacter sp.]